MYMVFETYFVIDAYVPGYVDLECTLDMSGRNGLSMNVITLYWFPVILGLVRHSTKEVSK